MLPKINSKEFTHDIELIVANHKLSYLEAIIHYGEKNSIEPESLASLVKRAETIKQKLESHCYEVNILKGNKPTNLKPFFEQ